MTDLNDAIVTFTAREATAALGEMIEFNENVWAKGLPKSKVKTGFLSGPPGGGKSAIGHALGAKYGLEVRDIHLSEFDAGEVGGFVYRDGQTMKKARPDELPSEGRGILILEEFSDASQAVQNIACRLVRDRQLGTHKLPDGWHIIVCGNRAKDRSGATQVIRKFSGRVCFMNYEPDAEEWLDDVAIPQGFHPAVIGYIKMNPGALNKFNPLHESSPTARTWEFVSDAMAFKMDSGLLRKTVAGYVGKAEGSTFMGFLKHMHNIPDIDAIVKSPDIVPVPTDQEVLYATIVSLASVATDKTVGPILRYLDRVERRELAVFAVRYMHNRDKALCKARDFATWLGKNAKEFIV